MWFFRRSSLQIAALTAVVQWLGENRFPFVLVGGYAASILGKPRFTQDIDFLADIPKREWDIAAKQARGFGLKVLFDDKDAPAHEARIIQLRHASRGDIDLIIAGTGFELEVIERAPLLEIKSTRCKVITPEDLIILKLIAGRPMDIFDCENVVAVQPKLDWERIIAKVSAWAEMTDNPQLVKQLEDLRQKAQKNFGR